MKILTVTYPENEGCINAYAAKCTNDLIYDVETAFEEMDISVDYYVIDEIANALKRGDNYWYDEQLCFEIIEAN